MGGSEGSEKANLHLTSYKGLSGEQRCFGIPWQLLGRKASALEKASCSAESSQVPERDGILRQQPPPWGWVLVQTVLAAVHI